MNLLTDNGDEKNDVKIPDGEVGEKIHKLFTEESKDTSKRILSRQSTQLSSNPP